MHWWCSLALAQFCKCILLWIVAKLPANGDVKAYVVSSSWRPYQGFSTRRLPSTQINLRRPGPDRSEWESSHEKGPNYITNVDLQASCSAQPYSLLGSEERFSPSTIQSDVLDFWGEGRIEWEGVVTGFTNSYNVNHQYKLVSPSSRDFGRQIPNRIPTESFENSSIEPYVANDTFRFVTIMGSPLTDMTAMEMTRVVRKKDGMLVLYGTEDLTHVEALETQAKKIHFHCDRFTSLLVTEIPELECITIPDHPQLTRVYHGLHPIISNHILQRKCITKTGRGYNEYQSPTEFAFIGSSRSTNGTCHYICAKVMLSNNLVSTVLRTDGEGNSSEWLYAGTDLWSSVVCPEGSVLTASLVTEGDENQFWYKCARISMPRESLNDTVSCETYMASEWVKDGSIPSGAVLVGKRQAGSKLWLKFAHLRVNGSQ